LLLIVSDRQGFSGGKRGDRTFSTGQQTGDQRPRPHCSAIRRDAASWQRHSLASRLAPLTIDLDPKRYRHLT